MRLGRILAIVVLVVGVVALGVGIAFVAIGASTHLWVRDQMRQERITLGIAEENGGLPADEVIDTAGEAQAAGDIVRSHRHEIAPTYGDLLGEGRYDPNNPEHLTYAQAMNLENYLYLATATFGLTNLAMGVGAALFLIGVALIILGVMFAFFPERWLRRASAA